jgi:hypothetical protein
VGDCRARRGGGLGRKAGACVRGLAFRLEAKWTITATRTGQTATPRWWTMTILRTRRRRPSRRRRSLSPVRAPREASGPGHSQRIARIPFPHNKARIFYFSSTTLLDYVSRTFSHMPTLTPFHPSPASRRLPSLHRRGVQRFDAQGHRARAAQLPDPPALRPPRLQGMDGIQHKF